MYMKRSGRENYSVPLVTMGLIKKKREESLSLTGTLCRFNSAFRAGEPVLEDNVLNQHEAAPWLFTDGTPEIFFCTIYYFKVFSSPFLKACVCLPSVLQPARANRAPSIAGWRAAGRATGKQDTSG